MLAGHGLRFTDGEGSVSHDRTSKAPMECSSEGQEKHSRANAAEHFRHSVLDALGKDLSSRRIASNEFKDGHWARRRSGCDHAVRHHRRS